MNKIIKNKYNEIRSGWTIICGLAFFLFVEISSGQLIQHLEKNLRIIAGCFVAVIITLGLILLLKLFYKKPLYYMGFNNKNVIKNLLYGGIFGFISISLTFFVLVITNSITVISVDLTKLFNLSIFLSFLAAISTGFIEETLFRSYIMTSLKTTRSKLAIMLISSVLFAIAHGANAGIGFIPFINIVLAGFVFGYLFVKSGNVWLPIGYHIIWNFFEGTFYGLLLSGSKAKETVIQVTTHGSDFITGGSFGPEGGIVVTIILILNFLWLYFFVKRKDLKECWHISDD